MRPVFLQFIGMILTGTFFSVAVQAQNSSVDSSQAPVDSPATSTMDMSSVKDTPAVKVTDRPYHLYRMNYWVSGVFCAVASAADVYAIPTVIKSKQNITPQELAGLNKNSISSFDRWALNQDPA